MSPFFAFTVESIQAFVADALVGGVAVGVFVVFVTLAYGRR